MNFKKKYYIAFIFIFLASINIYSQEKDTSNNQINRKDCFQIGYSNYCDNCDFDNRADEYDEDKSLHLDKNCLNLSFTPSERISEHFFAFINLNYDFSLDVPFRVSNWCYFIGLKGLQDFSDFWISGDIGTGISSLKIPKYDASYYGLAGITNFYIGYDNFSLNFNWKYIQNVVGGFEVLTIGIGFSSLKK